MVLSGLSRLIENECENDFEFEYDLDKILHPDSPSEQNYTACWKPAGCTRGQKLLVVIPYRNREQALKTSIPVLHRKM